MQIESIEIQNYRSFRHVQLNGLTRLVALVGANGTIKIYAQRGGQVFVSTHSPDFLNALKLEEIYCLKKENGFTTITHASDSANLQALVEAGDLPGYLWKQGVFEGLNR
ncbi:MAG: hypothetical protein Q4E06_04985 [Lautropia sp.]|nr:hypothetical protein [Lautropia sp.]